MVLITLLIASFIFGLIIGIIGFIAWYVDTHPESKLAILLKKIDSLYYH